MYSCYYALIQRAQSSKVILSREEKSTNFALHINTPFQAKTLYYPAVILPRRWD